MSAERGASSYGSQTKRGFLWALIGRLSGEMAFIPAAMISSRLLTPYDFGVMAIATFFVQVSQRLTDFGFNIALVRIATLTPLHTSSVFVVNLALGGVMWLVLTLSAPWLATFFNSPDAGLVIPVVAITFVVNAFGVVPAALLARDLRFKQLTLIDSANAWVQSIGTVILAWRGFGYWSLVYAQLLAIFIPTILKFLLSKWVPSVRVSPAALRELMSFGLGLHVRRMLDAAAMQLDNLVIGRTLGVSSLGIYDKAFTTMNRAVALCGSGLMVSMSVLSRLQQDLPRFREGFRQLSFGTALMGHPIFAFLIVAAEPLILVLFGGQWIPAVPVFRVLCVAAMFRLQLMYIGAAVDSQGRVWRAAGLQALFVALIVSGVTVGAGWGLVGAAFGVLGATIATTVLMLALLCRTTGLPWADAISPHGPALVYAISMAGVAAAADVGVSALGSVPPLGRLLVQGLAAAATMAACIRFGPFVSVRSFVKGTLADLAPRLTPIIQRWL